MLPLTPGGPSRPHHGLYLLAPPRAKAIPPPSDPRGASPHGSCQTLQTTALSPHVAGGACLSSTGLAQLAMVGMSVPTPPDKDLAGDVC